MPSHITTRQHGIDTLEISVIYPPTEVMPMSANGSKSAKIRAKLNHPIIDTDGHTVEFTPVFFDYIKEVGGAGMIERYKKAVGSRANNRWAELSEEERRYTRATCPP